MRRSHSLVLLLVGFVLFASAAAGVDGVSALGWLAGEWSGKLGSSRIEERWSEPNSSSMIGMFRLSREGKPGFYEFMAIEQAGSDVVLMLRHFGPGLIAWEEKDTPLTFRLRELERHRAVFAQVDEPTELIYERTAGDTLTISLIKEKDGERRTTRFRFTRKQPSGG